VLGDAAEAEQRRDIRPVGQQPAAVHAAGPARAGVGPLQSLAEPLPGAQHREGKRQQVVAERGRLRVLQVGLVGHQRAGVLAAAPRELGRELGGRLDQVSQVVAQAQPEGDPDRLPARPAGVQPAGHVAGLADEVPLARVVRLAVGRVVGEVGGRDVHGLQQQREQAAGRIGRDHPGRAQVEQVRDVGQVHPPVQDTRVSVLQLEPGRYELGRGGARGRPRRGAVHRGHELASCAAATVSRTPPVCQKTTARLLGTRARALAV
jgi:hypothetical protein